VIWIEDAATAIMAALTSPAGGIYDVVDDSPLTCRESIAALASAVGKRKLFRLRRWVVKSAVGADLFELIGRSQRVSNQRAKDALRWRPMMTCLPEGLARLTRPPVS
jgi:2-alkyl-3-oxoalkanoate reductase